MANDFLERLNEREVLVNESKVLNLGGEYSLEACRNYAKRYTHIQEKVLGNFGELREKLLRYNYIRALNSTINVLRIIKLIGVQPWEGELFSFDEEEISEEIRQLHNGKIGFLEYKLKNPYSNN
jgi:hypothetical protein